MQEYTTQSFTYTKAYVDALVESQTALPLAELLDTPTLRLWKDPDFNPNPETADADFASAIADFTDYSNKALTFSGSVDLSGQQSGLVADATWEMTTDPTTTGNSCFGYFVFAGGIVCGFEKFPNGQSIPMQDVGDYAHIFVKMPVHYYTEV